VKFSGGSIARRTVRRIESGKGTDDHTLIRSHLALHAASDLPHHRIAIQEGVTDVFGQALGTKRLTFTTTREVYNPYVSAHDGLYILDPRFEIPQWVLHTQAIAKLTVELYAVQPTDYFAFREFEGGKRATPPGKRVYSKEHAVGARWAANAHRSAPRAVGQRHGARHRSRQGDRRRAEGPDRSASALRGSRCQTRHHRAGSTAAHQCGRMTSRPSFLKPVAGVALMLVEGPDGRPAPVDRRPGAPRTSCCRTSMSGSQASRP
jgi:hypothetical protein